MANYKGHVSGGVIAGIIVVAVLNYAPGSILPSRQEVLADLPTSIGLVIIAALAALWPDVDTNSKAQNLFYALAMGLNIFLIINGEFVLSALLGLLAMTPIVGKHRGWTHSKLAMLLVPAPIILIPYLSQEQIGSMGLLTYIVAVAGYFSHLLLDGLIWKRIRIKSGW